MRADEELERRKFLSTLKFLSKLEELARIVSEIPMIDAADLEQARSVAKVLTNEQLKERFASGLRIVRDRLLELAACLEEMDARKIDVAGDKHLLTMLRKIYKGELLVDVVVRFAGRPYTFASLKGKPVEEQARIIELDDDEVEEEIRSTARPKPRIHRSGGESPYGNGDSKHPSLMQMAMGTPRDVAEMCLDLIRNSTDPEAVAKLILPELQKIKKPQKCTA